MFVCCIYRLLGHVQAIRSGFVIVLEAAVIEMNCPQALQTASSSPFFFIQLALQLHSRMISNYPPF